MGPRCDNWFSAGALRIYHFLDHFMRRAGAIAPNTSCRQRFSGQAYSEPVAQPPMSYASRIHQSEWSVLEPAVRVFTDRGRYGEKDGFHFWTNGLG
jgi:hypothetical protein